MIGFEKEKEKGLNEVSEEYLEVMVELKYLMVIVGLGLCLLLPYLMKRKPYL